MNLKGHWVSTITWVFLGVAILSAVLIAGLDIGVSANRTSGAGDIWWVDVPEVEQSYRKITERNKIIVDQTRLPVLSRRF
jgi:hypothetical protein